MKYIFTVQIFSLDLLLLKLIHFGLAWRVPKIFNVSSQGEMKSDY